jgi:hypothetical protein
MKRLLLISVLFAACKKNSQQSTSSYTGPYYFKFQSGSVSVDFEPTLARLDTDYNANNTNDFGFGINDKIMAASSRGTLFIGGIVPSLSIPFQQGINDGSLSLLMQVGSNVYYYSSDNTTTLDTVTIDNEIPFIQANPNDAFQVLGGVMEGKYTGTVRLQIAYGTSITDGSYAGNFDYSLPDAPIVNVSGSFALPQY